MTDVFRVERRLYKQLFRLLGPIVLQNLITASLSLADTFMVGALETEQLSALTLANAPFYVAMLFLFGLTSGGAVLISQYWGKKDVATINRVMGVSCLFAGVISFLFASAVFFFPHGVMGLTTNNAQLADIAARYGKIVAYSWFLHSIEMVFIGAHRSTENPKYGMCILAVVAGLNIFLNWVFIFGTLGFPAMGVEGAALATLISRAVGFVVTIFYAIFNRRLKLQARAFFHPGKVIVKDFLRYAAPVVVNETLWGLGMSLIPVIYGHVAASVDVVAAYSITGNLEKILTVVTIAVAQSTAVILGKEIGAGADAERAQRLGRWFFALAALAGVFALVLLVVLLFVLVEPVLYPLVDLSAYARAVATVMLLALAAGMPLRSCNTTAVVGILRGGGDVRTALRIDILPLYAYTVPVCALLALVFGVDARIVSVCLILEQVIKLIAAQRRFRSRRWMRNVTRKL